MRWWCETAKTQNLLIELAIYWYVTLYTRCAWPSYFFQECSNINVRSGVRILIVCLKVWISIWIWNGWFTNSHLKDLCVQKYKLYSDAISLLIILICIKNFKNLYIYHIIRFYDPYYKSKNIKHNSGHLSYLIFV